MNESKCAGLSKKEQIWGGQPEEKCLFPWNDFGLRQLHLFSCTQGGTITAKLTKQRLPESKQLVPKKTYLMFNQPP